MGCGCGPHWGDILNAKHRTMNTPAAGGPYETALVLGLGSSGEAAAELLVAEGAKVTAADAADDACLREKAVVLENAGVKVSLGARTPPDGRFQVCVLSPGIPADSEWVRTVEARGIEVVSELEFGWSRCGCKTLAITGSNGKSTMVKLCTDAISRAGGVAEAAGNYGMPVSKVALERRKPDWLVLEVSSFQMERISRFRPDVGVLLNVLPNHLDRHKSMETYMRLKARLFAQMGQSDTGIVPVELMDRIKSLSPSLQTWVTFGSQVEADYEYSRGRVVFHGRGGESRGSSDDVSFAGTFLDNEILGSTAAAAAAAVQACGFSPGHVASAARVFEQLPHRMQKIAEIGGVEFIDDSKATNLAALSAALRICRRPVRLIAGGRPKESDFSSVKEMLATKGVMVYLIGEVKFVLASAWGDTVKCRICESLAEAVGTAWKDSQPGETVLLSPGCTSFDQFKSFEERGERFSELVKSFTKEEKERTG